MGEKGVKDSDHTTASTGSPATRFYNKYTITFISPATSGHQSLLKCNYKGCDYDGCQPRFTGIGTFNTESATSFRKCSVRGYIEEEAVSTENHVGTGENAECSTGESCSVQTILV